MAGSKRNVTFDTCVLISYVISKDDNSIVKKVVLKAVNDDRLMLTDIIYDECLKYPEKKKTKATREEIASKLTKLCPIIRMSPIPSDEELYNKYWTRDKKDLKILYSVEMTNSVILVTYDDDFRDNIRGIDAEIKRPENYLYEDDIDYRKKRGRR